jgi:hypothetical protein
MIRELYTRSIDDPQYDDKSIESRTELDAILAKVRMILGTTHGEVLGDYNLGLELEKWIFTTNMPVVAIEQEIMDQLSTYVNYSSRYSVIPKVRFGHHVDGYDYAIIDIYVNDGILAQRFMVD